MPDSYLPTFAQFQAYNPASIMRGRNTTLLECKVGQSANLNGWAVKSLLETK